MRILYDLAFIIFAIFYMPYFVLKGKYHKDLLQRLGVFEKDAFAGISAHKPIWVHAVSVGEMKTAAGLIKEIKRRFPGKRFVISNVTRTGHQLALSAAGPGDKAIYFPLDLSFVVRRLVANIDPSLFISIETELWPNLITELSRRGVPSVLINGRISPGSFRGYLLIKPALKPLLNKMALFSMRSAEDAERIKRLGAPADKVRVSGNMKFDGVAGKDRAAGDDWPPVSNRDSWLCPLDRLIIGGSTHRGEDIKLLQAYTRLKDSHGDICLLIAPRHIERVDEIISLVRESGMEAVRMSDVATGSADTGEDAVYILDSIGHLSDLYRVATVVFMGGSLIPHGGQNFIEPAAYGKPVITGPHVHNFKEDFDLFLRHDAIEMVHDDQELFSSLERLLSDEERRRGMGEKARRIVEENRGSTSRNVELVETYLEDGRGRK